MRPFSLYWALISFVVPMLAAAQPAAPQPAQQTPTVKVGSELNKMYHISVDGAAKNEGFLKQLNKGADSPSPAEISHALQTLKKGCGTCMIIMDPSPPVLSADGQAPSKSARSSPVIVIGSSTERKEDCPIDKPFFSESEKKCYSMKDILNKVKVAGK